MSILSKITTGFSICKVYLDFDGLVMADLGNSFSESLSRSDWIDTYFTKSSVSFKEESFNGLPGVAFKQTLSFKLPTLNNSLATRTSLFHLIKNIKIEFNNGLELSMGRNDIRQNRQPRVETKSDTNFLYIEFYTESMMPTGIVTPELEYFGYPEIFAI